MKRTRITKEIKLADNWWLMLRNEFKRVSPPDKLNDEEKKKYSLTSWQKESLDLGGEGEDI